MKTSLRRTLVVTFLTSSGALAVAGELSMLNEGQMDAVTAGGQYSIVAGTGYAEVGTVEVSTNAKTVSKGNGAGMTKADLKVIALGTEVGAIGVGESAAGDEYSGVYGEAVSDQGRVTIRIKTMSKIGVDGDATTKSKIQVKASGSGAQTYTMTF